MIGDDGAFRGIISTFDQAQGKFMRTINGFESNDSAHGLSLLPKERLMPLDPMNNAAATTV
jgi:hypothetical protein